MSIKPHLGWQICFWIFLVWIVLFMSVALYYLWIYIKHRDNAFFRARMSNCTILMVSLATVALTHRIVDASIGAGYIANGNIVNSLFNFLELHPVFACYFYKYVQYILVS